MLSINLEPDRNRQVWREMVQCDLCVCVFVCVCVYVSVHVHVHVCVCVRTRARVHVRVCVLPVGSNCSFYLV